MQIFINDQSIECEENCTIAALLSQQEIQPVNIAVAVNNTVIPRIQWETTPVTAGSHIIIIKAVQGG